MSNSAHAQQDEAQEAATPYECAICFETYADGGPNEPVFIPCGHTCCRGCLRSKTCPFCRKVFTQAIASLPTIFSLIPPNADASKKPAAADILGGLSSDELEQLMKKKREEEGELKGLAVQREAVTKTFNALAAQMDSETQAVQADIDRLQEKLAADIAALTGESNEAAAARRAKSAPKIASLQREIDEAGDSLRQLNARIGELGGKGVKEGGGGSSSSSSSSNVARVAPEAEREKRERAAAAAEAERQARALREEETRRREAAARVALEGTGKLIYDAANDGNMAKLGPLVGQWRGNAAVLNWANSADCSRTPLIYASMNNRVECVRLLAATEGVCVCVCVCVTYKYDRALFSVRVSV